MIAEILLVEDDSSLNRAVSLKLKREGFKVHCAATFNEAENFYRLLKTELNLIICDVGLPDGSGLDLCRKVREADSRGDIIFLFLTAMDREEDMIKGYESGGDDYITKPFSLQGLVYKVKAMISRFRTAEVMDDNEAREECISSGNIVFKKEENRIMKDGKYMELTANEQKLLVYFLKNPMKVLSKKQLLEALWDVDGNFVDDNTVAVNIRRLREKVEKNPSKPEIIKNIRGLGYIWERECETF